MPFFFATSRSPLIDKIASHSSVLAGPLEKNATSYTGNQRDQVPVTETESVVSGITSKGDKLFKAKTKNFFIFFLMEQKGLPQFSLAPTELGDKTDNAACTMLERFCVQPKRLIGKAKRHQKAMGNGRRYRTGVRRGH